MTDRDEIDALAGEYVLGTLDAEERRLAEARLKTDAAFRAAVAAWERRLQPLADVLPQVNPPAGLFDRVLGQVATAGPAAGDNVVALRRALRRWRIGTAVAAAAAAVLFAVVVLDRSVMQPQSEFVAVLTAEGARPAFVAKVDLVRGTLSIRRVGAQAPADKSYELWAVEPNAAPRSLGVVEQASFSRGLDLAASGDVTLAISLEPKGGSPTGSPTGPIMFTGALVAAE